MWTQGNDTFLDLKVEPPVLRTIDLYEWLHLTTLQRTQHLALYARRVGFSSVPDKKDVDTDADNKKKDNDRHWLETDDCCSKLCHCFKVALKVCLTCGGHIGKSEPASEETLDIVCLKTFTTTREIDDTINGKVMRQKERLTIKKGMEGVVTGKTLDQLEVTWKTTEHHRYAVITKVDPMYISQYSPEWKEYMAESKLAEDDNEED